MTRRRPYRRGRRSGSILLLIPVIGILIGVGTLSYPLFSQIYYQHLNDRAISSMTSSYDRYDPDSPQITQIRTQAEKYNGRLAGADNGTEVIWPYDEQLDLEGTDVMAYVEIPSIGVRMPVYHGADEETMSAGAGHLEGTSLPVGGDSTHCVLSAHSGMKNMEAFDRLGSLNKGDLVAVTTLGETLVYEVETSETVLPYETESLAVIPGRDLLTLITCTPYGINDHRLLVHCGRTDKKLTDITVTAGEQDEPEDTGSRLINNRNINNIKEFLFRNMRTIPVFITACVIMMIISVSLVKSVKRRKRRKRKRYGRKPSRERPDNVIIRPGGNRWN